VDVRNERLQLICSGAKPLDTALPVEAPVAVARELITYEEDQELRPAPAGPLPYEEFAVVEGEPLPPPPPQVARGATMPPPARPARRATPPQPQVDGRNVLVNLPYSEDLEKDIQRMQLLHAIFRAHRGRERLILQVWNGRVVTRLESLDRVDYSPDFLRQIEDLLGEGSVQVEETG